MPAPVEAWYEAISRRHSVAMLHLEVGARHAGVDGRWEYLEAPQVARFVLAP